MEITQDVKRGKLHSAYAVGAFDKAKASLQRKGYRIISLEEQAGLRVQEGTGSSVSTKGNWTREGVIYVPDKGTFLTKNSPIMENAREATDCHRVASYGKSGEFYLNDEQVEKALADSVRLNVKVKDSYIPASDFGNRKETIYAFGKNAKEYGEFLKENGINSMQVYWVNLLDKPFARQVYLGFVRGNHGSELAGGFALCDIDVVRGVKARAKVSSSNNL